MYAGRMIMSKFSSGSYVSSVLGHQFGHRPATASLLRDSALNWDATSQLNRHCSLTARIHLILLSPFGRLGLLLGAGATFWEGGLEKHGDHCILDAAPLWMSQLEFRQTHHS